MICLQCSKPTVEIETYKGLEVNICPDGHRTGFMPGLTEQQKNALIAELFTNNAREQAI